MTTTIMRDSVVGDDWIRQTAAAVPVQRVIGQDGLPTGDILTGPVRLGYNDLFELPKQKEGDSEPKYGAKLLFTPFADFTIFNEVYHEMCNLHWAQFRGADGNFYGLHSPFHQQAAKANKMGYTPGCIYMGSTSKFKPPVVDLRHNPIVDKSRVYQGVWAICAVKPYKFGDPKDPKQVKGIGFGLQSVMIIGDDTRLAKGGAPADTKAQFSNTNLSGIAPPVVRPDIAQGMPTGQPGVATPPAVQQQHYTGQVAQTYAAPPPIPGAVAADDDDMSFLN